METADRFSFLALKDALANQLSSLINLSTVLPIYLSAHRLELKQVRYTYTYTHVQCTCIIIYSISFYMYLIIH